MTTTAAFWDKIADKYSKRPVPDKDAYEETLARTRHYLTETDTVLELGAGTGTTALKLAPYVESITATDISGRMTEIGREKAWEASISNAHFLRAGVGDAVLEGQSFDVVLGFNLLHLTGQPEAALRQIAPLVKTRGYLITKTPPLRDTMWFARPMIAVMRLFGKAPEVTFFTEAALEKAHRDAGFEIVETGDYPKKPANHFIVARKL